MTTQSIEYNGWGIITGQDFHEKFIVRDPTKPKIPNPDYVAGCCSGTPEFIYPPKDLTNVSGKMDIREKADSTSTLLKSLTIGNGMTFGSPDPLDGSVDLFIDSTETKAPPITSYKGKTVFFDLFLLFPDPEDNIRLIFGTMPVIAAVTDVP